MGQSPVLPVAAAIAMCAILTGCATAPAGPAPALPSASASPSSAGAPAPSAPASTEPLPDSVAWATFEVGDGRTSWRMPEGWTADIEREVVEGRTEWTDYRALVRDESGTPMLRFEAIASGGQYATDFTPCERPQTEIFEVTALGDQVADPGVAVVSLAVEEGSDGVTFAAGISQLYAEDSCEPEILALYQRDVPGGYDYLLLQIVDDAGMSYPRFADFTAARAYLETEEYRTIREVLGTFEHR